VGVGAQRKSHKESQEEKVNGWLLDTHVWLWIMRAAHDRVSARFFDDAEHWQRNGTVYLSPITCWELGLLVSAKQIELGRSIEALWERDTNPGSFGIAGLTARILIESTRLPGDLHRDPADRILAATARVSDLTLVTRDKKLLDYAKQGHLKARKP
jgi:PIN domain nuclease of toxin-antitoxin system